MSLVNNDSRALPVMHHQQVMRPVCPHHHPQAVAHPQQVQVVPVVIPQPQLVVPVINPHQHQVVLVHPQLVVPVVIPQPQLVVPVVNPHQHQVALVHPQLVVPVMILKANFWITRKCMVNQKSIVQ